MVTVGERLARLEERVVHVSEGLESLTAAIGDQRDPGSVRGRLHKMEATLAVIAWKRGVWRTWERGVLLLCSVAVAVSAVYRLLGG